jgi:hypothetical protein
MTRKTYRAIADALVRSKASDYTIQEIAAVLSTQDNFELGRFWEYIRTQQGG